MSLYGYRKKGKPAVWTQAFPERAGEVREPDPYPALSRRLLVEARKRGETCPVVEAVRSLTFGYKYGHPISAKLTECHHIFGKVGRLRSWEPGLLPVSKQGHRWIHSNPAKARELGFLGPEGTWNDRDSAELALSTVQARRFATAAKVAATGGLYA